MQATVFEDDQLSVALPPLATEAGLAPRVSIGAELGGADSDVAVSTLERLQLASDAQTTTAAASARTTRRCQAAHIISCVSDPDASSGPRAETL